MFQQQFAHPLRHLIRRKMADAGQHLEMIGRGDEIDRAFGGVAADGVVGVAPDIKRRHANGTERTADRAAGTLPGQRGVHRILVAEYSEMPVDRVSGNAIGGQTFAQPFGVIREHDICGIRFQKRLVVL
jgi:hypothetical protein